MSPATIQNVKAFLFSSATIAAFDESVNQKSWFDYVKMSQICSSRPGMFLFVVDGLLMDNSIVFGKAPKN